MNTCLAWFNAIHKWICINKSELSTTRINELAAWSICISNQSSNERVHSCRFRLLLPDDIDY